MNTINDYKLELTLLQREDTKNAFEHKIKKDWFNYIINQKEDAIAMAIIDLSKRYDIPLSNVACSFDPSMVIRVGRQINTKKAITK